MPPQLRNVLVIVAAGLLGAGALWVLFLLAGAGCLGFPLGLCPLPK
jgi:hypothetical protein